MTNWNNSPHWPIRVPRRFVDILLLTAIALDRGLISEDELHKMIEEKTK